MNIIHKEEYKEDHEESLTDSSFESFPDKIFDEEDINIEGYI